jgi:hypothetical protein
MDANASGRRRCVRTVGQEVGTALAMPRRASKDAGFMLLREFARFSEMGL